MLKEKFPELYNWSLSLGEPRVENHIGSRIIVVIDGEYRYRIKVRRPLKDRDPDSFMKLEAVKLVDGVETGTTFKLTEGRYGEKTFNQIAEDIKAVEVRARLTKAGL